MKELFARYAQVAWKGDFVQDVSDIKMQEKVRNASAQAYLDALQESPEGLYWPDIDYTDNERTNWKTLEHLGRLKALLMQMGEEKLEQDAAYRETCLRVLDYWLNNDFEDLNWWYNQIGMQKTLNYLALMVKPYLNADRKAKLSRIMGKGTLTITPNVETWTGANLIWGVSDTITHALFLDDEELLKLAITYAEKEIFIAEGDTEGIKEDGSFYQHGTQLYSGGYGIAYIHDLSMLMERLSGTPYQLKQEKIDLLVNYILTGLRYFLRRDGINFLCKGREISRPGALIAGGVVITLNRLLNVEEVTRKEEIRAMLKTLQPDGSGDGLVAPDTRYFYKSYALVSTAPGYNLSVRGTNKGFHGGECMNSENFLARNFGYGGVTCFMYTGHEYTDISAVWDFSMIPGSTAYKESDEELKQWWEDIHSAYMVGSATHCGGVGKENCGAMYMELLSEEGLHALKSWFVKDGLWVSLGSDVTCFKIDNEKEINTTLDQCYLQENASYNGKKLQSGVICGDGKIKNGAFAYYNLGEGNMQVMAESVTGSMDRDSASQSSAPVTRDVFKLSISHGTQVEGGKYAYAVLADGGDTAPASSKDLPIAGITNTDKVQAVEFIDGTVLAVFHKAGSFTAKSGKVCTAEKVGAYIF